MAVAGRWQLHPMHLFLVHSYLGLDDPELPLELGGFGRSIKQLGELARREGETMQRAGILVGDEVAPPLAEALRVLCKPYLWVDSTWFPEVGQSPMWRSVAAVTDGNRIVLGVQPPGERPTSAGPLTMEIHENSTLSQALLPTLPPAPPGSLGAAAVPAGSFRDQPAESDGQGGFLRDSDGSRSKGSIGDRQLELYRRIGDAQHARAGQLAANLRDNHGRVNRSAVLKWFDNVEPDGRYLDHRSRSNTGEVVYHATPADARLIGAKIEELVVSVR